MKSSPRVVDYQTLLNEGIGDNAFIHLTNVDFDRTEKTSRLERIASSFEGIGAGATAADPAKIQKTIAEIKQQLAAQGGTSQIADLVAESLVAIKVFPKNAGLTEQLVSLPRNRNAVATAADQIDHYNELRGYITIDNGEQTRQAIQLLGSPDAMQRDANAWLEKLNQIKQQKETARDRFLIDPMDRPPSRVSSAGLFACSLGSIVFGWLLLGSGTMSWLGWFLMPIPAILGLVGFPLRLGRGGRKTSILYLIVGFTLFVVGGYEMVFLGGFGQTDGTTIHHVIGFLLAATGTSAFAGAALHHRARQPLENILPPPPSATQPTTRPVLSYRTSADQLAAMANDAEDCAPTHYVDPCFMAAMDDSCSSITMDCVERLDVIGFVNPSYVRASDDYNVPAIALQFGCDHKVLAEVSDNAVEPVIRFTSVLHDGLAIVTVSETVARTRRAQFGINGVYASGNHDSIEKLLASHLELTIRMSEKRDSKIVTFDHEEKLEVCLYSRRVFADIQRQFGESNVMIARASYDRFQFPPQPVEELTLA
ncbi:cytochrome b family protein [Novipirellula artificiosorum]|uniref:Uncharacterized protein n=1 Tax=Novipirellula artificiosorum TaxID=2528016 RepID=A0A5C6DFX1_9BACT|nr:hypothetical protein [Novipirellula artificiosorum]TWU35085.1 hypothetical protein Poly41_42290 [Novipirellula artificiosorum]